MSFFLSQAPDALIVFFFADCPCVWGYQVGLYKALQTCHLLSGWGEGGGMGSSTMQNVIGSIRISHSYQTFFFFYF